MITRDDLITRFGTDEIAQQTNTSLSRPPVIDEVELQKAIDDAIAEVMSYVHAAGVVLVRPSAALRGYTCDVARYRLFDKATIEIVQKRYDQAIAWLREAMKRPAMLDDDLAAQVANGTRSLSAVMPNQPTKWADLMKDLG